MPWEAKRAVVLDWAVRAARPTGRFRDLEGWGLGMGLCLVVLDDEDDCSCGLGVFEEEREERDVAVVGAFGAVSRGVEEPERVVTVAGFVGGFASAWRTGRAVGR